MDLRLWVFFRGCLGVITCFTVDMVFLLESDCVDWAGWEVGAGGVLMCFSGEREMGGGFRVRLLGEGWKAGEGREGGERRRGGL